MTYHKNSLSMKISTIGVARIFDWGGGAPKRKSHAMMSSFRKVVLFMKQRYRKIED